MSINRYKQINDPFSGSALLVGCAGAGEFRGFSLLMHPFLIVRFLNMLFYFSFTKEKCTFKELHFSNTVFVWSLHQSIVLFRFSKNLT